MILILLSWLYMSFVCFVTGRAISDCLKKYYPTQPTHPSITIMLGLVVLSFLSNFISIFYKISWEVNLVLLFFCILYVAVNKTGISPLKNLLPKVNLLNIFLLFCTLFIALGYSAVPSKLYDDGIRYIPYISHINSHPAIPGLGNLNYLYAYNSSWHTLSALFNFSYISGITTLDLNGYLFAIISIYSLNSLSQTLRHPLKLSNIFTTSLIIPTFFLQIFYSAPTDDIPTIYITLLIFVLLVEKMEEASLHIADKKHLLIVIFLCFLFTVKLTSVPLAIILFYVIILPRKHLASNPKLILIITSFFVLIVTPWLIRTIILSGYLIYPLHKLDLFLFDWKMPREVVVQAENLIHNWGRYRQLITGNIENNANNHGFHQWLNGINIFDKGLLILSLISFLICLLLPFSKMFKKTTEQNHIYHALSFLFVADILLLAFKSPEPRYGYPFLFLITLFAISTTLYHSSFFFPKHLVSNTIAVLSLLFCLLPMLIALTAHNDIPIFSQKPIKLSLYGLENYILSPADYPSPSVHEYKIKNTHINIPYSGTLCWNAPFPCTSIIIPGLSLRKESIKDGFFVKK